MSAIFVTGTDTEIGKTIVSCRLVRYFVSRGYRCAGIKPIASGAEFIDGRLQNDDARMLQQVANVALDYGQVNPVVFEPACSPHFAAREAQQKIDLEHIADTFHQCAKVADWVVVEGVGGWRVPLCHQLQTVDLVRRLDLPVVMVCGLRLGCISHSILTAEAILQDGVTLVGWVANRVDPHYTRVDETIDTIQSAIKVPLLASLDYDNGPNMHQATLTTDTSTLDNWITSHQPRPA